MNFHLRNSQRTHSLRRLRFLSSSFAKLKKSGTAAELVLKEIFTKISKLINELKFLVGRSIIKKTIGTSLLLSGLFINNSIQAQNFAKAEALPSFPVEGALIPVLIDIDSDGDLDIAGVSYFENYDSLGTVLIENIGTTSDFNLGSIDTEVLSLEYLHVEPAPFMDAGDLDNDGDYDLISYGIDYDTYQNQIIYYENLGADGFAAPEVIVTSDPNSLFIFTNDLNLVDVDSDGDLDVAGIGSDVVSFLDDEYATVLVVWKNNGTPEEPAIGEGEIDFRFPSIPYEGIPLNEIADFDNDGDLDILLTLIDYDTDKTAVSYIENNGSGFEDPIDPGINSDFGGYIIPTSGDIDGDGDIDLVFELYEEFVTDPNNTDLYWLENLQTSAVEEWTDEEGKLNLVQTVVAEKLSLMVDLSTSSDLRLCIFDSNGSIIMTKTQTTSSGQIDFDVTALSQGMHFLHVNMANKIKTLKFIKS